MITKNRSFGIGLLLVFLAASLFANGEQEQSEKAWPAKSVQIVVAFNPGGDTDYNARVYAKYLKDILGVPVVVTNVTGSGGTIGMRHVLDSDPDGYTVLWHHSAMMVSEAAGLWDKNANDYEISCIGAKSAGVLLYADGSAPYNSFDDVVAATKKTPDAITFAANTGATTYLAGVTLYEQGVKFKLADFGGGSDRLAALMGGHVDIIPNAYGMMKDYIDSGDVKALASLGSERIEEAPDVPTVAELGFPDSTLDMLYFFAFPKGTSREIVETWADAAEEVAKNPQYQEEIHKAYFQKPFYLRGNDALDALNGQREVIMKYAELLKVN
ncbi:tripartite tricarboxylate transporter substrate binding protein [Marispirochaeta aestuarii]|nr:tripartite tricarboxylate transporter substrate binding protein [Marispirochaeta aestuarii]